MPAKTRKPLQPPPDPEADEAGYDHLIQSIKGIAESLQVLNQQAVQQYAPVIESIVRSRSRDTRRIEHTLDGLLDFCGYEPALVLYKKLCRHYWDIDPLATASYINAYRDMWDSDEAMEAEGVPNPPEGAEP